MHSAISDGNVAVVTGGASGLGLAAANRLAAAGLSVCLADRNEDALAQACLTLAETAMNPNSIMTAVVDVADDVQMEALEKRVLDKFGRVDVLMNNAGMQPGSTIFDENGNWRRIIDVNMWGVIRGSQIFAPGMIASGRPGLIVNTGSKQGITTPPGDPAYNVSKAAVRVFTEALQHELRNTPGCRVEARLFIPGFVYTPLTAHGRTEKPADAWTPEQTVDFLLESLDRDDFYILCPDNDVDRAMDGKRVQWSAGDIVENRPPLSRWHDDHKDAFADWMKK